MTSLNNRTVLRVVIPARYASTRLPGKPLIDLAGLPMVVRVYDRVRKALPESDIVVATDDQRIADVLGTHAIPWVMTAASHESGTDRTAEVAQRLQWAVNDIIINVQGDEPLIPIILLQRFASFCADAPVLAMATIATPIGDPAHLHDPNVVKVVLNQRKEALLFSRSAIPFCRDSSLSEWPLTSFLRHVGIYAYRNEFLQRLAASQVCEIEKLEKLEQLRAMWLGVPIMVMKWHETPPHGVDTPHDAERVAGLFLKEKI